MGLKRESLVPARLGDDQRRAVMIGGEPLQPFGRWGRVKSLIFFEPAPSFRRRPNKQGNEQGILQNPTACGGCWSLFILESQWLSPEIPCAVEQRIDFEGTANPIFRTGYFLPPEQGPTLPNFLPSRLPLNFAGPSNAPEDQKPVMPPGAIWPKSRSLWS
jgi:hypothetical protein